MTSYPESIPPRSDPGTHGRALLDEPSPRTARLVLATALLLAIAGVALAVSPLRSGRADRPPSGRPGDVALYLAEIARMRAGEGYYQAAAAELRQRGYPTRSVFNWRTPLPIWLVAHLPGHSGAWLLRGLALAAVWCAVRSAAREGRIGTAVLAGVLMFGAVMPCFLGELYVMPVLWAGVLIVLSVCAYAAGRWPLGFGLALAALAQRDLAGPYCALCALLAAVQGRRREVIAWGVALVAYAVLFGLHVHAVRGLVRPGDLAHEQGWLNFGGAAFVLSLVQMNAYLLVAPQWLSALYFVAAMLGLAAWNDPRGRHVVLAACLYVALFAFVGQPFNQYWGSLIAPLLALGAARGPAVLLALCRAAAGGRRHATAALPPTQPSAPAAPPG
jgi:hypothetical protein